MRLRDIELLKMPPGLKISHALNRDLRAPGSDCQTGKSGVRKWEHRRAIYTACLATASIGRGVAGYCHTGIDQTARTGKIDPNNNER